jgi:hypothetical protein
MSAPQLVTTTQTVPNNSGSTVTTPLPQLRTVTYVLRTYASNVNMPYAVEVGGVVGTEFNAHPKSVRCALNTGVPVGGKIVVQRVPAGSVVRLYLNSDAHPEYRNNPVYAVTPTTRNVEVQVFEKDGHSTETDVPVPKPGASTAALEKYDAVLTGITWMKISHKYALSEVDAFIPPGASPVVLNAVRSVYAGLSAQQVVLEVPGIPPRVIAITLQASSNASENIAAGYTFLTEGLTRVHPAAYAALFSAAIDSGVNSIVVTSGWRPMLGSIGHRAGLGIDVSDIGSISVNRAGLTVGTSSSTNATAGEKTVFRAWKNNPTSVNKVAWKTVLDQNEPTAVRAFRDSLDRSPFVKQILDPWFVDLNSLDQTAGTPNSQRDRNEQLHKDHLHITIHEPKILGG